MIPIFIITCDRLEVLKTSIQSYYDNIETPFEIVVVDFGSTYEPTRDFLRYLEREGKKVHWKEKIRVNTDLNSVDKAVQEYFEDRPKGNYVVTDPDVALDNVEGDILDVYSHLLESLTEISVVGPMLRIDDIPDCYPKKAELISNSLHVGFHSRELNITRYKDRVVKYIFALIDTTFGMSRAGMHWRRHMSAVRVLPPYSAKHLDWYLDPDNLTQDQKYYMEHASKKIAHWSKWD